MSDFETGDMMRSIRLTLLALLGTIAAAPLYAQHQAGATPKASAHATSLTSDAESLALIKQRVDEKRSAGIVVGVIDADGHSRVVSYGDPGPGQPPLDGNSVFEIGSISKVFTATVLAEMVQEGVVHLDDPAQKYLPPTVQLPTRNGKAITLANLSEQ